VPRKHAEIGQVPGPRQPHRRRSLKHPAVGPGLGQRNARQGKDQMGRGNAGEQDARQQEGAPCTAQGEVESERHGAAGSELCQRVRLDQGFQRGKA
jgi:hypothetical protein